MRAFQVIRTVFTSTLLALIMYQNASAAPPVNDDCAAAVPITNGITPFDTTDATTDGVAHPSCQYGGATGDDIWYTYTATCTGVLLVTTCEQLGGSALYDTDIVIYEAAACPPGDAALIACNDDAAHACGSAGGGYHSAALALVTSGSSYLIRVGGYLPGDQGTGNLLVSCTAAAECTTAVSCQNPDQDGHGGGGTTGATSDANPGFAVADNFRADADQSITSVCWYGFYINFSGPFDCSPGAGDDFSITYYADAAGAPGAVHAGPFAVTASAARTGQIIGTSIGAVAEYGYEATHAPVPVLENECYWIEIQNDVTTSCYWLWSTAPAGDELSYQDTGSGFAAKDYDLAYCLDITTYSIGCAAPEGACCLPGNTCLDGIDLSLCDTLGGDFQGAGTNCIDDPCPPANDECTNAIALAVPSVTSGTTLGASVDTFAPDCLDSLGFPVFVTAPGVWYQVIGTGNTMSVSTCSPATDYDTQLTVYCGCCDTLACVRANDDDSGALPSCDLGGLNRKSTVNFCSQLGTPYLILVHGYNLEDGNFELIVSDNGTPCGSAVSCVRPSLTLVADNTCSTGGQITVDIVLADLCPEAVGGQFFLEYDDSKLSLDTIAPGDAPFTLEVYSNTSTPGIIEYATGVVGGGPGARDGVMARVTFNVIDEICDATDLVAFRPHSPPTRVTNDVGIELLPLDLVSIQPITIDFTPPLLTIPPDINVFADAGLCSADVNPGSASATDNCDLSVDVVGVRDDSLPLNDPYPAGIATTIEWTATDDCGNETVLYQTVTVSNDNEAIVDLAYDGALDNSVMRCIEFIFSGNDGPVTVNQVVTFSAAGTALGVSVPVACGDYDCLTVRDPLHTLASSVDLTVSGTQYIASATGADAMIGGNLNGDLFIDVLDFGVFIGQYNSTQPVNTNCATPAPHADITGNGNVGSGDFTFIQINFLEGSDTGCTALVFYGGDESVFQALMKNKPVQPVRRISVADLNRRGLGKLSVADLNHDFWLDEEDIAAFLQGARP